jgi:hypothetical protein
MKENNINMMKELGLRVMNDIFDDQIRKFMFDGKSLLTSDELAQHIEENLGKYMNPDEIKLLLMEQVGATPDNDEVYPIAVRVISHMCSFNVIHGIQAALTDPRFIKDNPFDIFSNPMHFMIHKYLREEMKVDIDFKSSD